MENTKTKVFVDLENLIRVFYVNSGDSKLFDRFFCKLIKRNKILDL